MSRGGITEAVLLNMKALCDVHREIDEEMAKASGLFVCCFLWLCSPARAMASSFTTFPDHTQRRATFGRTPLNE
jgi:hypothetical protein